MSRDTPSDVLRAVRLRGAVSYCLDGAAPWVAEAPAAAEIIPAIMPGVEHLSCWAAVAGRSPIRLAAGDLVLLPQGDGHVMSSAPGRRGARTDNSAFSAPRPPQLPYTLSIDA